MEHSLPPIDASRPWRTAAIVASAVAALELVALLVIGIALVAGPVVDRIRAAAAPAAVEVAAKPGPEPAKTSPAQAKPAQKPKPLPLLTRRQTTVMILNGNGRTGEAASAAVVVRARGYRIGEVGNAARSDYGRSVVMYRPGREREARRLARDTGVRLVGPLDGLRVRRLKGAQLALVIGNR
jgi:LytR cell envelope-related transcriptional attenuator